MPSSSDAPESPREPASEKTRGFSLLGNLLLMVCGLTVLGIMGYLFLNRLTELNQQVAALSQQVEGTIKELQVVAEKAEASSTQATRAEERALEAARGRVQAEAEQAAAKKTAEQAREEAQRAQQEAELAQEETQVAQEEARLAREEARLAQQEARLAQEEAERIRREREDELNRLQTALNRIGETRRTALGLVMTLGSDSMQFEFDQATLRPENRELLSKIVGILLTSKNYGIYVYGHTDNIGSEEYNLELSKRRAQSVRDYLAESGIAPEIITTEGFGKSRPLVPERSEKARAKNRRVEIGIVDTVITFQKSIAPGEE
ncbi:MAG: OmpA family protein [Acidobacteria bacterium]|nr:OmpA family protein [Acidobacteriota bacterium]